MAVQSHHQGVWRSEWQEVWKQKRDLIENGEGLVELLGGAPIPTEYGDMTYVVFGDKTTGLHHEVMIRGNMKDRALGDGHDVLVRLHSACSTSEHFHASNCECREELHEALTMIGGEGRGAVVYLAQEGRGIGLAGKIAQLNGMFEWKDGKIEQSVDEVGERIDTDRAYKQAGYPSEERDFDVAGEMLHRLGIKSVRLLTNNPRKIEGVASSGIYVTPVGLHIPPANEIIAADLRSKALNLGHDIDETSYTYQERQVPPSKGQFITDL